MHSRKFIKPVILWTVRLSGGLMITAAVWAGQLGFDRDAGWGPARLLLLGVGLTLIFSQLFSSVVKVLLRDKKIKSIMTKIVAVGETSEITRIHNFLLRMITRPESSIVQARQRRIVDLLLVIMMLFTIGILTWIISVGFWLDWPDTTNYFHLQAQAFTSGRLNLLVEPSEKLLSLNDPYTFEGREGSPYLWDVSFFDGKYYLYWGPVPGLTTVLLEFLSNRIIGDHFLVYLFTLGSVIFSLLALRLIWYRYFRGLTAWMILPLALLFCLGNPVPWLLGRPAVYEAAIASGQFFFMGGMYWFLLGLLPGKRTNLINSLSGVFFVGAIGSRITLLPGILALSAIGMVLGYKKSHGMANFVKEVLHRYMTYFGLIVMSLILLAWYNYARFGDVFELGHRYQLSYWGIDNPYDALFSWRNILPNLYNYFLNSYRSLSVFPYIKPRWGQAGIPVLRAAADITYRTEKVTGIFITSPLIIIGCIPIYHAIRKAWARIDGLIDWPENNASDQIIIHEARLLYVGMLIVAIALILPLILFSFNTARYLFDFSFSVTIMAAIGIGLTLQSDQSSVTLKSLIILTAIHFTIYSTIVGVLLGITGYSARFEHLNPELFEHMSRLFS